jgi:hypothetical protein
MGGTVFVLGAGASYGDTLQFHSGYTGETTAPPPNPPLSNQFFDAEHLHGEPEHVEKEYARLVAHIRNHWGIDRPFGDPPWTALSIEEVFTSLALLNDFSPAGTSEKAISQLLLNDLTRYIRRSIGYSTLFRFGPHTRLLAQQLKPEDSVLTFNYDLLMDQELINDGNGPLQYQNFCAKLLGTDLLDVGDSYREIRERLAEPISPGTTKGPSGPLDGLYLKLHGSLNWFVCPNRACPRSNNFAVVPSVPQCLGSSVLAIDFQCNYCHSVLIPLLVPPLVQKPVMNNPQLRNIWSNAFAVLANASKVVVIGLSFQPSDFYAAWLFRYALEGRKDVKVWVVNPLNEDPGFRDRMKHIFSNGYDDSFLRFDQICEVVRAR